MAAGILVAVAKPWAAPDQGPSPSAMPVIRPAWSPAAETPGPTTEASAPASPTIPPFLLFGQESPSPYPWDDPALFHCIGIHEWLLVTDEVQFQGPIRTWIRIDPRIGATGPDDPAIPWYRIGAGSVPGIGVCLPSAPAVPGATPVEDAAGTTIVVRRPRDASGPVRGPWVEVHVAPHAGDVTFAGGAMVAPDRAIGDGTWPPGRYVIEVRPGYVGPSAWFGLEIARTVAPSPSPPPSGAPAATPPGPDAGAPSGAPRSTPAGPGG